MDYRQMFAATRRIAVLGIKPETHADQAGYYVPAYMAERGFEVVPVPVYYPNVTRILGQPVYRTVAAAAAGAGPIDMVNVFRRGEDIPPHVPDLIAAKPKVVWFQLGIRNDEAARALEAAGITVVQDKCLMVEHRRGV